VPASKAPIDEQMPCRVAQRPVLRRLEGAVMARARLKWMSARGARVERFTDVLASGSGCELATSLAAGRNAVEDALEVESLVARLCARYPVV
jgi:hypothetical protein